MERGTRELALGEYNYSTVIFPPSKSFRLLAWLGDILGEGVAAAMGGSTKTGSDLEITDDAMGRAAKSLFSSLHGKDAEGQDGWDLILALLSDTYVMGNERLLLSPNVIEVHFSGRMGSLVGLVAFVLKENYSDFLEDALVQLKASGLLPEKSTPSSSNSGSTELPGTVPSTGESGG